LNSNHAHPRIRIAVFVRNPNAGGGIQVFAKELAEHLPSEIEMCFISKNVVSAVSKDGTLSSGSYIKNFKFNLRSFDLILMHQFSVKFYIIARLAKRPIVVVSHIWDTEKNDFKSVSLRQLKKLFLKNEDLNLVFVSNSVRKNLGLSGEVIPNRSSFSQHIGNHKMVKKDLIFVGRFTSEKGVHVFLEIVRSLNSSAGRPISATMIGEGPELKNIENSIVNFGLVNRVELVPWINRDRLKEMYIGHRILIVPSLWDEPYGLVAAEGLSLGLKVFCSDRPGLIEATLNHATYFDPTSIASVTSLIENELGQEADLRSVRAIRGELEFSKTVEQYCSLFRKIYSEHI
jgi:glycosyltransferase involved in cell wall biosynthesis